MVQLNDKELQGLQAIADMLHLENKLNAEQRQQIVIFVKSCISNHNMNAALRHHYQRVHHKDDLDDALILTIILSFRTRSLKMLSQDFFDKLSNCQQKFAARVEIPAEEKLTLQEFAAGFELAAIYDVLQSLARSDITQLDPELQILHQRVLTCKSLNDLISKSPTRANTGMKLFESSLHQELQAFISNLAEVVDLEHEIKFQERPK